MREIKNLSLNKPIKFISNPDIYQDCKLEYINDGTDKYFWTDSFQPVTFEIDLLEKYYVRVLNLKQLIKKNGRCKNFILSYSNDDKEFKQCLKSILPDNDNKMYSYKINILARFWRFQILDNYDGRSNGLTELQLLGGKYLYLLKQNNEYFTIKPEFYNKEKKVYLPCEYNLDINGFKTLEELTSNIIIGEKIFRPIDKFKGEIEIIQAEEK